MTEHVQTALLKKISDKLDKIIELMGKDTAGKPTPDISKLNEEELAVLAKMLERVSSE